MRKDVPRPLDASLQKPLHGLETRKVACDQLTLIPGLNGDPRGEKANSLLAGYIRDRRLDLPSSWSLWPRPPHGRHRGRVIKAVPRHASAPCALRLKYARILLAGLDGANIQHARQRQLKVLA